MWMYKLTWKLPWSVRAGPRGHGQRDMQVDVFPHSKL